MKTASQRNLQQAKQAAQRIYKRVNYEGGNLQNYELSSLMQETYDFLKIPFKPSINDLKQYSKVLDANGDGAVSLQDLQTLAVQYLGGDGVLNSFEEDRTGNKYAEATTPSVAPSLQNYPGNEHSSYGANLSQSKPSKFDNQIGFNYSQYLSGSKYNEPVYTNTAYNNYGGYQDSLYSNKMNISESGVGSGTANIGGYQTFFNPYSSSASQKYPNKLYSDGASNQLGYSGATKEQENTASKQYSKSSSEQSSKYTPDAQNYLTITRGIYSKYAEIQTNTITRDKVALLLNETYSALGRKGYYPSEEDISVWMKLCDTNSDGHVEQTQYEYFVVRALERSGIQVNYT